jgi:serine/threonine-protein kinase
MSGTRSSSQQRAQRRVGAVLRGKYTLERVLGVGGMAVVYLGVHRNGSRVAVKVLHPELSVDDDLRARFVREGYVANSIGHDGAVRVIDDDVAEDGAAFLVMELLLGETLERRRTRRGGRLPPGEVLALAHQLLDVLAAAHAQGVVHRDVKPENLFLTRVGALKVLDFGIARFRDASDPTGTITGARLGTPAFMPPEQALGRTQEIDARADVWAVGAPLFTLLSGHLVHEAPSAAELVVRTATQPARSLAKVAPRAPAAVVALVDRALAFAREDRWQSAREMAEAVAEAYATLQGEPVTAAVLADLGEDPGEVSASAATVVPVGPRSASVAGAPTLAAPGTEPQAGPATPTRLSQPTAPLARASQPTAPLARASQPTAPLARASQPTAPLARASQPTAPLARSTLPSAPPPRPSQPGGSQATGPYPTGVPSRSSPPLASLPPAAPARAAWGVRLTAALLVAACAVGGTLLVQRLRARAAPAGSATAVVAPPGCTSNRACVAAGGGHPALCRKDDGVCVPLESVDCHVLAEPGDLQSDATVWIGAMFAISRADAAADSDHAMRAVDLARRDFVETTGGLPPARPGGPRRPIAVVACDDGADPDRAAAHLVDVVRVPAIIGFARSKEVLDLAATRFVPRGVMALAANTATMLRSIPRVPGQPRLVWRTTISADMRAAPEIPLVADVIEPALRAVPGLLRPGEPMRVAFGRVKNPTGVSYADIYIGNLRFNGKSATENGDAFRQVSLPDSLVAGRADGEMDRVVAELIAFDPHLILHGGSLGADVARPLEQRWPASRRRRPRYLFGELTEPEMFALLRERPDVRGRILGVETVSTTPQMGKFVIRYNEVFSPPVKLAEAVTAPYDAFYVFAYAAAALGEAPLTGVSLSGAIARLVPPGEAIDVGPGGIHQAFTALAAGRSIDLVGTVTSLDFDLETGDATADFAVHCLASTGFFDARDVIESGIYFDARTRKLRGTMRCP